MADNMPDLHDLPEELPEPETAEEGVKEDPGPQNPGPEVPPFSVTPKVAVDDKELRDQVIRRLKMHEEEMLDLELDLWEMTVQNVVSQEIIDELQKKQSLIYSYVVMYRNTFGES